MPTFNYTAIDAKSGSSSCGTIEGGTSEQVIALLKSRGLAPLSLVNETRFPKPAVTGRPGTARSTNQKKGILAYRLGRSATTKELTLFTRQLATLVKAGMPLLRGLEVLARQEKNESFDETIRDLADAVRSGGTLSDGLRRHPKLFDRLYINMVKAGEVGGRLDEVLDRLARFMEKSAKIRARVKSAMTYPLIVIGLSLAIVGAMMVFVVPRFENIFAGLLKGQPLPALTQSVLNLSSFVTHHVALATALLIGGAAAMGAGARTLRGQRWKDGMLIRLPLVGELFLKASVGRFSRTFGTLLSSGVPMLQALTITRDTSGNVHVAEALSQVHDRVKEGESIANPLAVTGIFPAMVTSMIEVGEETGALPEMLAKIADAYDEDVDNAVASLTSLIEPIMIVILALLVGTIVIALFLPIVSIIQHLQ